MGDMTVRDTLIMDRLNYANGYLTLEKWAEHNGLTLEQAKEFMELAIKVQNSPHPDS